MDIKNFLTQIENDEWRDQASLHLTANETIVSKTAQRFMQSGIANRYYFGGGDGEGIVDFGPSTYRGLKGVQAVVDAAIDAAKTMLGASYVNFSCLSGVHAMMCAILSTTEPGDTVMTVDLAHGGHFATKPIVTRLGRGHVFAAYDVQLLKFDAEEIARVYRESGAKAFYMDVSFYINPHNLREIRDAIGPDAIIIYDASHTVGLIMGGAFQDPFSEGADVICANTHKTLPGPQKGLVAFKDKKLGERGNDIINSGLFSSPHTASMVALAITILEIEKFGKGYATDIIENSNSLAESLVKRGYTVRKANTGRYSENHQVHLMTHDLGDYRALHRAFDSNNISVNFANPLGGDMFIRLGTQEITRRGMKSEEMDLIAGLIDRSLSGDAKLAEEVREFISDYNNVHYSFDAEVEVDG